MAASTPLMQGHAMFSVEQINFLRQVELAGILAVLGPGGRLLELGAGTGEQARELSRQGFDVVAIDLPSSVYAASRQFAIGEYDGKHIPLPDASVDVVFSSYVLEYIPNLAAMHAEIRRVLKPSGYCVHVLPTHGWRFWTIVCGLPNVLVCLLTNLPRLLPNALLRAAERQRLVRAWRKAAGQFVGSLVTHRHGDHSNLLSELWRFRPAYWRREFSSNGFVLIDERPMGIFYTGHCLFGSTLGVPMRRRIAHLLGSAGHLFKIVPVEGQR